MKSNNMLKNITSLGSATLVNALLAFIIGVVTRNILGPEQYGYWLTVSLVFVFIPLFQLGTLNAMNREVPFYIARKEMAKVQSVREIAFTFLLTIPVVIVGIMLLASLLILNLDIANEYKIGLLFLWLITIFTYLSNYIEMYYKSEQNFKRVSTLITIKSLSQTMLTLLFVWIWGYIGLYLGMLVALVIQVVMGRQVIPLKFKLHSYKEYMTLIKIGMPILIVGIVWSIVVATDRILISLLMTPVDLGNYGVALLVFSTMMLFPQVISQVMYPKVVELVSKEKYNEVKILYWRTNKILALLMLVVLIIGYFMIPYFVNIFMPEYKEGIVAAQILLIGLYPLTLVNMAAAYFNSTNSQGIYIFIQVITIFINVILSLVFISFYKDIMAIALATSISFIIYALLMNIVFLKKIKIVLKKEVEIELNMEV